jgi:acyl carrier protein
MSQEEIRTRIVEFIQKNFVFNEKRKLRDDESLLESGVIDSTGILELINFIEESFRIKIDDNQLVANNFDSINKITTFVLLTLTQVIA